MEPPLTFDAIGDAAAFEAALPVLRQLRGAVPDDALRARWRAAAAQGYRLIAARRGGALAGLAGLRVIEDLCHGRSLYVDDLVVCESVRSGGVGAALLAECERIGRAEGCDVLRLASGFPREAAHRFYEREGLPKTGYVFKRAIAPAPSTPDPAASPSAAAEGGLP
jgi:GNAT superfamily N-acetyltransferase